MKFEDHKNGKHFCVYPFIHLATFTDGSIPPCCVGETTTASMNKSSSIKDAWNSDELKYIRKSLLQDEPVLNCSQCYSDEASGVHSHRMQSNDFYYRTYKNDIDDALAAVEEDGTMLIDPFTLDIRAGNTCNLKCIMCRPNESSKWFNDATKMLDVATDATVLRDWDNKININTKNFAWIEREEFWNDFKELVPTLKEIIFGGGEPFLSKSINNLIKYMVDTGHSTHIKIRFHTNGTSIPKSFWELVDKFREIELLFSIDGYADQNYYVRYPAEWDEIVKNLYLADQTNANTMILFSMHSLSAYSIVDLYKWRMSQPFKKLNNTPIILGRVYHPNYLNPQGLPAQVKESIHAHIMNFINEHKDPHDPNYFDSLESNANWILDSAGDNFDSLLDYIRSLDKIRETSFEQAFPEYSEIVRNARS
jgi:sulfatase maturation enzyme AslB (radical SAM superfamily)